MIQTLRRLFLTLLFLSISSSNLLAVASETESESPVDIMGTVADHDYFKVPPFINGGKIYLPRLLFWEDASGAKEFSVFSSTKKAIASGLFIEEEGGLVPADGGHIIIDFSITSHLVYFWFGLGAVFLFVSFANSRYKKGIGVDTAPKGALQNIFEVFYEFIRDEVAKPNIDDRKYRRYMPYLFTVFMAIAFMNSFGLLPWAATATADITVTAVLAIFTFVITQFSGTKDHWMHVFWFPGVPLGVKFLMIPVELIGLFTKPFALAIRLFANMMSGKIMIIAILGLIFIFNEMYGTVAAYGVGVFLSVPMTAILYILKLFVALLQAYIFTLLSAVFIGMAAEDHDHAEEHYYAEHAA